MDVMPESVAPMKATPSAVLTGHEVVLDGEVVAFDEAGRPDFGRLQQRGKRPAGIGSLLLGYHEGGVLRYAGRVGTGFTEAELDRLHGLLQPLARDTSPFEPPPPVPPEVRRLGRFAEPVLVAEIAFSEWTHLGTLRQPSYQGLRDDKPAAEVGREAPPAPS